MDYYKKYNERKYEKNYWQIDRSKDKWFSKYVKAKIIGNWVKKLPIKGVLLDAGGGVGNWSWHFKDNFKKVIVMDVSKKALSYIPEKDVIKKQGSLTKVPLKKESVDCIFLIDVFEHIKPEDLGKMLKELRRVLKKKGEIFIFTSQYGFGLDLWLKRTTFSKNRLTKGDYSDGHLNRLKYSEIKKLVNLCGLKIKDHYHYSIIFQQLTDLIKDSFAKIISKIIGKKKEIRAGQSTKESIREKQKSTLFRLPLYFMSWISYLDIVLFGKILPGSTIFLKLVKK